MNHPCTDQKTQHPLITNQSHCIIVHNNHPSSTNHKCQKCNQTQSSKTAGGAVTGFTRARIPPSLFWARNRIDRPAIIQSVSAHDDIDTGSASGISCSRSIRFHSPPRAAPLWEVRLRRLLTADPSLSSLSRRCVCHRSSHSLIYHPQGRDLPRQLLI